MDRGGLIPVDRLEHELALVQDVPSGKRLLDQATAVQELAKRMKLSLTELNRLAAFRLRLAHRIGEMLLGRVRSGRPKLSRASTIPDGVTRAQSSRWQAIAKLPIEAIDEYQAAAQEADQEMTLTGFVRFVRREVGEPDERYTPAEVVDRVHEVFDGKADLDPCCDGRHRIARRCHHLGDDGLSKRWNGRIFLNPPYSEISAWLDHLVGEVEAGRAAEVIAVTPLAPDRCRWERLRPSVLCLPTRRIEFETREGLKLANQTPSCVWYLGSAPKAFRSAFGSMGLIYGLGP